jgi:hypothetical protein
MMMIMMMMLMMLMIIDVAYAGIKTLEALCVVFFFLLRTSPSSVESFSSLTFLAAFFTYVCPLLVLLHSNNLVISFLQKKLFCKLEPLSNNTQKQTKKG